MDLSPFRPTKAKLAMFAALFVIVTYLDWTLAVSAPLDLAGFPLAFHSTQGSPSIPHSESWDFANLFIDLAFFYLFVCVLHQLIGKKEGSA